MSPRANSYRAASAGSFARSARFSGFPAYVSLSRLMIDSSGYVANSCRMKFDPMNPQPPVTRIRFMFDSTTEVFVSHQPAASELVQELRSVLNNTNPKREQGACRSTLVARPRSRFGLVMFLD